MLWAGLAIAVAAIAFFAGQSLRPEDEPELAAADLTALPYTAPAPAFGRSLGGFTGFGEQSDGQGRTVLSGRVTTVGPDAIGLDTPAGPTTVSLAGERALRRLEAISRNAIGDGATVLALISPGSGEVTALLLLEEP
jgi:hypothetical protein